MPGKRKNSGLEQSETNRIYMDEETARHAVPKNKYYLSVSRRYNFAKYLVLITLMFFLFFSLMANRDNITYENFLLLIKDVNLAAQTANKTYETITYSEDSEQSVTRYKNNLVVTGSSGVKIFSGTGSQVYSGKEKFSKPHSVSSDKYLLVYDFGGTKFSLYNTFTSVFSDSFDYPITDGAVSDSGAFALVSRTKEHNYAVMVYSKNCNLINRYRGSEYVMDVALSDDGERIAVAKVDAEGGYYVTSLMICKPGSDGVVAELKLNHVFPVRCAFSSDGDLALVCDKEVYFYDKNGSLIGNYPISGELSGVACEGNYLALTFGDSAMQSSNSVTVLDYNGNVKQSLEIEGRIADVEMLSSNLFVLCDAEIRRINILSGKTAKRDVGGYGKDLVVFTADDVMLCTSTKAEHLDLDN